MKDVAPTTVLLLCCLRFCGAVHGADLSVNDLGKMTIAAQAGPAWEQSGPTHRLELADSARAATATGVAEILHAELGFSETMAFQAPLILRGLSGNRLLVLRNGMPQKDSYAAGFMTHTTNPADLGRLQIEKGLRSVRYGSGAIAGTVDLQSPEFKPEPNLDGRFALGYGSNAQEKLLYNRVLWTQSQWGVRLSARGRQANAYSYGNDSLAHNTDFQDADGSLEAEWRLDDHQRLRYHASLHRGGPWGKPRGFTGTNYLLARTPVEDNDNHALRYEWLGANFLREMPAQLSWTREHRIHDFLYLNAGSLENSYREVTAYNFQTMGAQVHPLWQPHANWQLRTGAEAFYSQTSSPLAVTDYYEGVNFHNRQREGATALALGAFAENDVRLSEQWIARLGGRYDRTRLYEGEVFDTSRQRGMVTAFGSTSGVLGLRRQWTAHHSYGLNVARTFRVPEPAEMFGQSISGNGVVYGNPALRSEKGWALDLDWQRRSTWGEAQCTPFFWWLDDMISKEMQSGRGITYKYMNVGKARLWGGEVQYTTPTWKQRLLGDLGASLGSALVQGRDITGHDSPFATGTPLVDMPPWRMQFSVNNTNIGHSPWKPTVALQWNYYPGPGYHKVDLHLSCEPMVNKHNPRLDIAITNLLDTRYIPQLSLVPAKGRDLRTTFSFHL